MPLGWEKGMGWREQRGVPRGSGACGPESLLICRPRRLVKAGGAREVGTSVWPFPKQRYHQKVILMNSQDLPNPQHLNYNPRALQGKHSAAGAQAVPLPLWH